MSDAATRALERKAQQGSRSAQVKLFASRARSGEISREEVARLLAGCDAIALEALGRECGDLQVLLSAGKKNRLNGSQAEGVLRSYYHALGYTEDSRSSSGSLVDPLLQNKIVFKKSVIQIFRGGRGRWHKYSSKSKIATAEEMVANARQRAEGGDAPKKLAARRAKKKVAKKRKAGKASESGLKLRIAVAQIASTLSPADRAAIMLSPDAHKAYLEEVLTRAGHAIVHPQDTEAKVDALLSIRTPPLPLPKGTYQFGAAGEKAKYSGEHTWTDKGLGRPIRVWRESARFLGVELGDMPVDPFQRSVSKAGMARSLTAESSKDGFSASLRVLSTSSGQGIWAGFLFMIIVAKARKGVGTKYLRAWCKLLGAYGANPVWVAEAVGEQGLAWIEGLQAKGEVWITSTEGSNLFVRCERALADPRQGYLFGPAPKANPLLRKKAGAARLGRHDARVAPDEVLSDNLLAVGPFGPQGQLLAGFYSPETYVVYFVIKPASRQELIDVAQGKARGNLPLFMSRRFIGGPGTIEQFWKNRLAKKLAGAVQYFVEGGKRRLVVTHMAVKPAWRRQGVNARILRYLTEVKHPGYEIVFHDLTDAGRAFMTGSGVGSEY